MKRDEKLTQKVEKKPGFSEKDFIDYLEERFRKLKQDEQKFRDEVLARHGLIDGNDQYLKAAR